MTNAEAIQWLQLDIDMMKFDPSTGEDAYLNDDAKKTLEALDMAIAALNQQAENGLSSSKNGLRNGLSEANEKCSNKLPCGWCSLFDASCDW